MLGQEPHVLRQPLVYAASLPLLVDLCCRAVRALWHLDEAEGRNGHMNDAYGAVNHDEGGNELGEDNGREILPVVRQCNESFQEMCPFWFEEVHQRRLSYFRRETSLGTVKDCRQLRDGDKKS